MSSEGAVISPLVSKGFISFLFFSSPTVYCVSVSMHRARAGGVGENSPLLHWQLLIRSGAEKQDITRQPISLWIMSYLSLSPASPFRCTFLFFHSGSHSLRQTRPQGEETWGCTHTHTPHISSPFGKSGEVFFFWFFGIDQLGKRTLNVKDLKDSLSQK